MRQLYDPKLRLTSASSVDHTHYNRRRYDLCHAGFFPLSPQKGWKKNSQFQHMNVTIHTVKPAEAELCFIYEAVQRKT